MADNLQATGQNGNDHNGNIQNGTGQKNSVGENGTADTHGQNGTGQNGAGQKKTTGATLKCTCEFPRVYRGDDGKEKGMIKKVLRTEFLKTTDGAEVS